MAGYNKTDQKEKQERIYKVGLMLRRKPIPFILEYTGKNWGIEKSQTYTYIALAKKEWEKYFKNLKRAGMSYHVAQLRDIKDQAYSRKVIIGRGDKKETVTIADLGLIFEITKEEAKLMGLYPTEKHKVEIEGELGLNIKEYKMIKAMSEEEREKFIKQLSKVCGSESNRSTGKDQKED